jgi:hypothetical protein
VREAELGKTLLKLDAAALGGAPDARELTWRVLERDRRRVRRWTAVTVGVWILAAAMVLSALVAFGLLMPQRAKLVQDVEAGKVAGAERQHAERDLLVGFLMGAVLIGWSVFVLALAALCTVLLLSASRRATLRQVNASLLEVAEQLKRLRQGAGTVPPLSP